MTDLFYMETVVRNIYVAFEACSKGGQHFTELCTCICIYLSYMQFITLKKKFCCGGKHGLYMYMGVFAGKKVSRRKPVVFSVLVGLCSTIIYPEVHCTL